MKELIEAIKELNETLKLFDTDFMKSTIIVHKELEGIKFEISKLKDKLETDNGTSLASVVALISDK